MTKSKISLQVMTKEEQILYEDIGTALLKYFKSFPGSILIDDVKIDRNTIINKWKKMSFWFKVGD